MDGSIERCRHLAKQLVEQIKSSAMIQQAGSNTQTVAYGAVFLAVLTWLLVRLTNLLKKSQRSRPATPDLEKPAARSFKAPTRMPGGWLHTPKVGAGY